MIAPLRHRRRFVSHPIKAAAIATLLAASAAPYAAHAQFTTSGTYDENVVQTKTVNIVAAGSTYSTVAAFQTAINAAFVGNTGGVIGFDNVAAFNPTTGAFTATYGTAASNTLTVTSPSTALTNYSIANDTTSSISAIGTNFNYIGNQVGGTALFGSTAPTPPTVFQNIYQFSAPLSTFAVTVVARNASRNLNFQVNFNDGSSTTLTAAQGNTDYVFFNLSAPTGKTITYANLYSPDGFIRMDDMAFIVAPTVSAAAPEPNAAALLLSSGIVGMIPAAVTRRRKRASGKSA